MKIKQRRFALALWLVLILVLALLAGCGGGSGGEGDDDSDLFKDKDGNYYWEEDYDDGSGEEEGESHRDSPFTRDDLQAIYDVLDQAYDDFSLREMTYEYVRDTYLDGVEGSYVLSGTTEFYDWFANDNFFVYLRVFFDDFSGDGTYLGSGLSGYFPE